MDVSKSILSCRLSEDAENGVAVTVSFSHGKAAWAVISVHEWVTWMQVHNTGPPMLVQEVERSYRQMQRMSCGLL